MKRKNRKNVFAPSRLHCLLLVILTAVFLSACSGNSGNQTESQEEETQEEQTQAESDEKAAADKESADRKTAADLDARMAALWDSCYLTAEDADELNAIRASYNGLTAEQQALVTCLAHLTAAEQIMAGLETAEDPHPGKIVYQNVHYGFNFYLPESWSGYAVILSAWTGYSLEEGTAGQAVETGPILSIRHPQWTQGNPRQDIPVMVFTLDQWEKVQQEKINAHGAAPIPPGELGRNSSHVFALPPRYNYAFPTGFEEVEDILNGNPLETFERYPGILKEGSTGAYVKLLQQVLMEMPGYMECAGFQADGDFGSITRNVVMHFQESVEITADGIVGSVTWGKLFE